jgi:hypothetical protein
VTPSGGPQPGKSAGPQRGNPALTGWGQDHDKGAAAQAGFDAHLAKLADTERLERVICTVSERVGEIGSRVNGVALVE